MESTLNRFQRLARNKLLGATFGQTEVSLDFRRVIDEGAIVLVSLATAGAVVSKEDADTFATLMLADLWTAAKERGKDTGGKPMYCYIDEFQTFVSPTIAENLDEARGFGLHLALAHQYPSQLRTKEALLKLSKVCTISKLPANPFGEEVSENPFGGEAIDM